MHTESDEVICGWPCLLINNLRELLHQHCCSKNSQRRHIFCLHRAAAGYWYHFFHSLCAVRLPISVAFIAWKQEFLSLLNLTLFVKSGTFAALAFQNRSCSPPNHLHCLNLGRKVPFPDSLQIWVYWSFLWLNYMLRLFAYRFACSWKMKWILF